MAKASVELRGGSDLISAARKLLREIKSGSRKAVSKTGRAVLAGARSRAPRDKGVLAADITLVENPTEAEAYVGIPSSSQSARYAAAAELGTGDTPAQPYLYPATRSQEGPHVKRVEDELNSAIGRVAR